MNIRKNVIRTLLRTAVSEKLRDILAKTRNDIVLFNEYILQDPDPEPWKPILIEFFSGNFMELIMLMGRKSGKSVRAAKIALFYVYKFVSDPKYRDNFNLIPGQPVYILVVSVTAEQAENIIIDYCKGFTKRSWYMRNFLNERKQRADELTFETPEGPVIIRGQGSSSGAMRGYPCIVVIFDELAHFVETGGRMSGKRVYEALKPNIAIFRDEGKIIVLTTPGGKSGIVWDLNCLYEQKKLSKTMLKCAPTWEMNLDVSKEFLKSEEEKDPVTFACEYGANFYETMDAFLESWKVDKCVREGEMVLPPPGPWDYYITMDPAIKKDAYSVALAHMEGSKPVIDFIKKFQGTRREPVDIAEVERFAANLCKDYSVRKIGIDQNQSASTVQNFKREGLPIEETPFTSQYNMAIYERLKRFIYAKPEERLVLPPYPPAVMELKMLQIKRLSNRFSVSAPKGHEDDCADVIANALFMMTKETFKGELLT